ncbi:MAG: hypothetical protein WCP62_05585 [Planctomycetota bacterium]
MIHRPSFVNRTKSFAVVWLCLVCCFPMWAWTQGGGTQEPRTEVVETEYYRQAVEKLGPSSKVLWSEPGENSLNRWRARSIIEASGVIASWDVDKLVVIKPEANGPTNFPGDLVVGIEPGWKSLAYTQVHSLFEQRKFKEVLQQGQAALSLAEIPRWQQRVVVSEMVDSAMALQQYSAAARVFRVLAQDSTPELLLSRIPLPWSDELLRVTPALTQEALGWIESDKPAMQLVGASWLLAGEHRLAAIDKLKSLSSNASPMIAAYSKIQLWRLTIPEEILSDGFLEWVAQRDALPVPLQAGPTMLLAHRLEQANQPKLAIAEWLRVTSMHADRYHLAEQAVRRGADAAKKLGDEELAQKLVQKIGSSFSLPKRFGNDASARD